MSFILEVDPVGLQACLQCCNDFVEDVLNLDSDVELSCTLGCTPTAENNDVLNEFESSCETFDDLNEIESSICQVGEDFRLIGVSEFNETYIVCDNEGDIEEIPTSDLDVESTGLDVNDCSSCCESGAAFDEEYSEFWDVNSCRSVCEDPVSYKDCVDNSGSQRLGCALGYQLRLDGDDEISWSGGDVRVACVEGSFINLDDDNSNEFPFYVFGIVAGVALVGVLIAVVVASRPKKPLASSLVLRRIGESSEDLGATDKPNEVAMPEHSTDVEEQHAHIRNVLSAPSNQLESKKNTSISFDEGAAPGIGFLKRGNFGTYISSRFNKISRRNFRAGKNKKPPRKQMTLGQALRDNQVGGISASHGEGLGRRSFNDSLSNAGGDEGGDEI